MQATWTINRGSSTVPAIESEVVEESRENLPMPHCQLPHADDNASCKLMRVVVMLDSVPLGLLPVMLTERRVESGTYFTFPHTFALSMMVYSYCPAGREIFGPEKTTVLLTHGSERTSTPVGDEAFT